MSLLKRPALHPTALAYFSVNSRKFRKEDGSVDLSLTVLKSRPASEQVTVPMVDAFLAACDIGEDAIKSLGNGSVHAIRIVPYSVIESATVAIPKEAVETIERIKFTLASKIIAQWHADHPAPPMDLDESDESDESDAGEDEDANDHGAEIEADHG